MTNCLVTAMVVVTISAVALGCGDEKKRREEIDEQAGVMTQETVADLVPWPAASASPSRAVSLGWASDIGADHHSRGA